MNDYLLGIRISKDLKTILETEAKKLGVTLSTYARILLIKSTN